MKNIKYWHVKLFQNQGNTSLVTSISGPEKLLHEGYSKDEVSLPPRDGRIKFLTEPCGVEVKTVRADLVDSIVCTPVYEDEAKADSDALSKNTHLLKSEFFTIECDLPTPEELDKIFAQLCQEFVGTPLSCLTFPAFFNEIVERTKGLTGMKMNVKPDCMFSQNALRGKSIRPKH